MTFLWVRELAVGEVEPGDVHSRLDHLLSSPRETQTQGRWCRRSSSLVSRSSSLFSFQIERSHRYLAMSSLFTISYPYALFSMASDCLRAISRSSFVRTTRTFTGASVCLDLCNVARDGPVLPLVQAYAHMFAGRRRPCCAQRPNSHRCRR